MITYFASVFIGIFAIFFCKKVSEWITNCRYKWVHRPVLSFESGRFGTIEPTPGGVTIIAMFTVIFTAFFAVVFSPFYWEFPGGMGTVVSVDKDGTIRDSSATFGIPDVPWSEYMVVNLSRIIQKSEVTIQPVTANPKVRHIVSTVSARLSDEQAYLLSVPGAILHKDWFDSGHIILGRQVESAIYEFHEKYSVELEKLYNPHDTSQQAKFYELVAEGLAPELAKKGIEVTNARFNM